LRFILTLNDIYSRRIEHARFSAQTAAYALVFVDTDDPVVSDDNRLALARARVITRMIGAVLAGMDSEKHLPGVHLHKNAVVTGTHQPVFCQSTHDLTTAAARAKRLVGRRLNNMTPECPVRIFHRSHPFDDLCPETMKNHNIYNQYYYALC